MISRANLVEEFKRQLNIPEVLLVDEFETVMARHICSGVQKISLLPRLNYNLKINDREYVSIDYYLCTECGKAIIRKGSLEILENGCGPVQYY